MIFPGRGQCFWVTGHPVNTSDTELADLDLPENWKDFEI